MEKTTQLPAGQPTVVKYVQPTRAGIQSRNLTRHALGYVTQGKRYIYYGDIRHEVDRGSIYYFPPGLHYTEDIPEEGRPFEQIVFYYGTNQLARIISDLSLNYGL